MLDQNNLDNQLNESLNEEWQPDVDEHEESVNSDPEADQIPLIDDTMAKEMTRVLPRN